MSVWLIAAGGKNDPAALANYGKTLSAPISSDRLQALPPHSVMPAQKNLYAWGFPRTEKGGNERKFDQLAIGDICFFCTTRSVGKLKINAYHWVAKVAGLIDKADAQAVSRAFWDSDDFYPYWLQQPIPIDVSFESFSSEIDPGNTYYNQSPQSSMRLASPKKLKNIIERFGSVEAWAEDYIRRVSHSSEEGVSKAEGELPGIDYKSRLPAMRDWLITLARTKDTVAFSAMQDVFGIDRLTLKHSMDRLAEDCLARKEPVLTALIVYKDKDELSPGLLKFGVEDDHAERAKAYAYWAHSQAPITACSGHEPFEVKALRFATVETRPEQAAFRRRVFTAFGGRCAISGCSIARALDAAHRHGRKWRAGDNASSDGLLLRKDLHALYDARLLTITEEGEVSIADEIRVDYAGYAGRNVNASRV